MRRFHNPTGLTAFQYLRAEAVDKLKVLRSLLPKRSRDIHVFAIGLPRSGTHSIAYTFSGDYRTKHEPFSAETITYLLRWKNGVYGDNQIKRILKFRDYLLNLEMEASYHMYYFSCFLPALFPQARFILTVREPISWAESLMNQESYIWGKISFWQALIQYRHDSYELDFEHESLRNSDYGGIFPLRSYLRYWNEHLKKTLEYIPKERLLVVDTFKLEDRIDEIASFVGADLDRLSLEKIHSGRQEAKRIRLDELVPASALVSAVRDECLDLIDARFPFLYQHMPYL